MKAALRYDVVELILVAVDSSAANDNAHPATRHNVPRGASPLLPHARRRRREVTSPCTDEVCAPSTCKGGARFPQRSEDKRGGGLPNPILFNGGQTNLYVYVGNDPLDRHDPRGLWGLAIGISGGAGIWGGVDVNAGIGFDFSNGNLTVFNYAGGVATVGAGDYGGIGIDLTAIVGTVEQFAGAAVAARAEAMGFSFGADHGGSVGLGIGFGGGTYIGIGLADTHVSGFQVRFEECGADVLPYERRGKWLP